MDLIDVYNLGPGHYHIRHDSRTLRLIENPDPTPAETLEYLRNGMPFRDLGLCVKLEITGLLKTYRLIRAYPVIIKKPFAARGFINVDALLGCSIKPCSADGSVSRASIPASPEG